MNTKFPTLTGDKIADLFSIYMRLDTDLRIELASPTLIKFMPGLSLHPGLLDAFKVPRPVAVLHHGDLLTHLNELFLMTGRQDNFAVRGQMVLLPSESGEQLWFLGSPWLVWLQSNAPELHLNLSDFSLQDVQLDQLFYMSTEKRMVHELETLNTELEAARTKAETTRRARNRLFAEMSHEMRTPLNGVVSALSLLAKKSLPEDSQELVGMAQSSSHNLLRVINYALDITRLDESPRNEYLQPVDGWELLQEVREVMRARALESQIDIRLEYAPDAPVTFLSKPDALRQSLLNLAVNALNHTRLGHITLRVLPHQDSTLRIEVQDTGCGISEEDLPHVFDVFWTRPSVAGERREGAGLGLDIVQRNVDYLDGSVGVVSSLGRGSTFWLEFPLLHLSPEQEAALENQKPPVTADPARYEGSVLLVDDNRTNLDLGRMKLEQLGIDVVTAIDGIDALDRAGRDEFDLVLMDLNMPRMDGVECTRRIHSLPGRESLPIMALTAATDAEREAEALAAGMAGYITKPMDPEQLHRVLSLYLRHHPATEREIEPAATPVFSDNTVPMLEAGMVDKLRQQVGAAAFGTLMSTFLNEVEQRRTLMHTAIGNGDASALAHEAHTLASSCNSFGLLRIGKALILAEAQLKTSPGTSLPPLLDELEDLMSQSLEALAALR